MIVSRILPVYSDCILVIFIVIAMCFFMDSAGKELYTSYLFDNLFVRKIYKVSRTVPIVAYKYTLFRSWIKLFGILIESKT